jgi:hypothetical protein
MIQSDQSPIQINVTRGGTSKYNGVQLSVRFGGPHPKGRAANAVEIGGAGRNRTGA